MIYEMSRAESIMLSLGIIVMITVCFLFLPSISLSW